MNFKVTIVTNVTFYNPHAGLIPINTDIACFKGVPLTLSLHFNKVTDTILELKKKGDTEGLLKEYFRKDKGISVEGSYHLLDEDGNPTTRRTWIGANQLNVLFNTRAQQVLGVEFKILNELPQLSKLKKVVLTKESPVTAVDLLYFNSPENKALNTNDSARNIRVYRLNKDFSILKEDIPGNSPIKLITYEGEEYPLYVRVVRVGDFIHTFTYYCQRNITSCGILNVQGINKALSYVNNELYIKHIEHNILRNIIEGTRATTLIVSSTTEILPALKNSTLLNGVDITTVEGVLNLNSSNRIFTSIITKQKE